MAYIKVKGKTYGIHTGSRGGRYWIDDDGKKHYLKSDASKSKKEEPKKEIKKEVKKEVPKLRRWVGRFTEEVDGDHDGFSEWCEAYTKEEAEEYFRDNYRHNPKVELDYVYEE